MNLNLKRIESEYLKAAAAMADAFDTKPPAEWPAFEAATAAARKRYVAAREGR